jgi:kynurenine formamidase
LYQPGIFFVKTLKSECNQIMKRPFSLVDLTHSLTPGAASWNGSCGFEQEIKRDYNNTEGGVKLRVQQLKMHAGIGTHMDAPSHFVPGGLSIADIPLDELAAPCVVLDVSSRSHPTYSLSVEDIRTFERDFGKISEQSFIIVYTGWDRFWNSPAEYRNNLVFPSISGEAAEYLLEKKIVCLGIYTLSPDRPDSGFPVHHSVLGAGKYIVENVANAKKLTPTGTYSLAFPIKSEEGTEAPMRLMAMILHP